MGGSCSRKDNDEQTALALFFLGGGGVEEPCQIALIVNSNDDRVSLI